MSLFIGSSSQYSYAQVDPEKLRLAEIQYIATAHTFNRILATCEKKCLPHEYGEGELATGETTCIDRCVSKYVKANYMVGNNLQTKGFDPYSSMPEYQKIKRQLDEAIRDAK